MADDISDITDELSQANDITSEETTDTSDTAEAETQETESQGAEETDGEAEETEESQASGDEATEAEAETEGESETEESTSEEITDPKELARRAYQQREQARKARESVQNTAQQEYLDGAADEQDFALRQLQVTAYNQVVERNTDKLTNAYEKALANIDLFASGTPEQKEEMMLALDEFGAMHVQTDENGNPIKVDGDLYQYLTNKAERVKRLAQVGARTEKAAGAKQKAATTPAPSASPKEKLSKEESQAAAIEAALDRM